MLHSLSEKDDYLRKMKLFTSYFYMVRFMKPYQIPISTALWDPKWFHQFKGQSFKFIDKNGVVNGLRAEKLHPGSSCEGLCNGKPCQSDPSSCMFLKEYEKQVFSINREDYLKKLRLLSDMWCKKLGQSEEPEVILLVHEASDNICSERGVLQKFFECDEWRKD